MSVARAIRWSGVAAFLGGLMYAAGATLHPDGEKAATIVSSPTWTLAHVLTATAGVFLVLGLTGSYARQVNQSKRLGLIGYVLAFVGTSVLGIGEYTSAFISPVIAAKDPALMDSLYEISQWPQAAYAAVVAACFVLGYVIYVIASLRAGVLSRWISVLLILGLLLMLAASVSHIFDIVGAIALGAAYIWMGIEAWSSAHKHLQGL